MDAAQRVFAKLAWRMLNCKGELWHEMLKAKYGMLMGDGVHFRAKTRSSQSWRGVIWEGQSFSGRGFGGEFIMTKELTFGRIYG